jgi:hypothetical protein
MWNKDIRDAMRLQKQVRASLPSPVQQEALRAQAQTVQKMIPSPEQMEFYRRQAEEARRMAASIDPATLRALREASSSQAVLGAVEVARRALGERGFAAAQVLTDRELHFRTLPVDRPERDSEGPGAESSSREITPEQVRKAEELAASDEVRELLERAVPEELEREAETCLEDEDSPASVGTESDEVVLYGVDVKLSNPRQVALVLFVALQAAGTSPELADRIRQALDDLSNVVGGLGWWLLGRQALDSAPEGSGVAGEDLLRFAGSIDAEDLDAMERVIEEDCERIPPVGR